MRILLIVEHVRATRWSPSAWAGDLGLALHARGHDVVVACDGIDDAASLAPLRILTRTTPRRAEHRHPIAFASWASRLVRRGGQDVSISLSPCVGADLWSPIEPAAAHYWRRLVARRNPASIAMGLTHTGWLPAAFVAEALARGRRPEPIGVPAGEGGLGFASSIEPASEGERRSLRDRTRALMEIAPHRPVLVVSGVHHDSPGLDQMLGGLAAVAGASDGRTPLLFVLGREGYSVHARARRAGCEHLVRLLGGTRRVDAVLAAGDAGVAPLARTAGATSGRFVADCLRLGVPVVADRQASGVALLEPRAYGTAPAGIIVEARTPAAWSEAISRVLDPAWREPCARAARDIGATLSMDALVDRLEASLERVRRAR